MVAPPVSDVKVPPTNTSYWPGMPGAAQSAAIARQGKIAVAASTHTTTHRGMRRRYGRAG
jgi:hypothetical protein